MEATTAHGAPGHTAPISEVLDGLNDLLQLDHDAVRAYDIAIEKLTDREQAQQIAGFKQDHERHIRELNALVAQLGGTPVNEPHATGPLKEALQSLGGMAGDKGVLVAWRTNELQVRTKYDSYAARAVFWPAEAKRLVDRNALDEERHYHWVAGVLQGMGIGGGADAETHLLNKLREQKGRAADAVAGVQTRVTEQWEGVSERAREVGGQARDRAEELQETVETQVRQSPVKTLLMVFVAGFVIGRILR